jgi:hypothetical protein
MPKELVSVSRIVWAEPDVGSVPDQLGGIVSAHDPPPAHSVAFRDDQVRSTTEFGGV